MSDDFGIPPGQGNVKTVNVTPGPKDDTFLSPASRLEGPISKKSPINPIALLPRPSAPTPILGQLGKLGGGIGGTAPSKWQPVTAIATAGIGKKFLVKAWKLYRVTLAVPIALGSSSQDEWALRGYLAAWGSEIKLGSDAEWPQDDPTLPKGGLTSYPLPGPEYKLQRVEFRATIDQQIGPIGVNQAGIGIYPLYLWESTDAAKVPEVLPPTQIEPAPQPQPPAPTPVKPEPLKPPEEGSSKGPWLVGGALVAIILLATLSGRRS